MVISLDLHGVINDLPHVFSFITQSIILNGGEVHIITGSKTQQAFKELTELGYEHGIHFTHVVGLPDYLLSKGYKPTVFNEEFDNYEFPIEIWNGAKAEYCEENNISLHMDDTIEYGETFKTPFARVWTKNK